LQLPELEVQELEEHDGFDDHPLSSKPHSPTMPQASPIRAFLQLLEIAWLQRASVDLEETEEEHKCKNFLNAHHFLNCLSPTCTTTIISLEPCALNAAFEHFIPMFNKISLLCGYH
jgi:hypothetical protein